MIMYFKIPEFRLYDFVRFTEMYDMRIIISCSKEELFNEFIQGYFKIEKSNTIPREIQMEKLNKEFGKFVKEA